MKSNFLKASWILIITILLLGVPRLAGFIADQFDYSIIDPDAAFAWISVHHVVQALFFLIAMVMISRLTTVNFGFNLGKREIGWFYVRLFLFIFFAYAIVSLLIVIFVGSFQAFPYPLNLRNIVGQLSFQLLLSGPSEELIFRAFAITMLSVFLKSEVFGAKVSLACILAALIFGLAHVEISFSPISLSYDPFQVVYATALGIFYGLAYERSESMVYPMIMHSISNVVAVGVSIIAGLVLV